MTSLLEIGFILSNLDLTSEYASAVNLYRTCKSLRTAFAGHQAAPCTLAFMRGLFKGVHIFRPDPTFLRSTSAFECYDSTGEYLHFVVRIEGVRSMRIFCAKHNYITAISNIRVDAGVFSGVLDYTNVETGTVVLAPFDCPEASPWWIHGIPRNLEVVLAD